MNQREVLFAKYYQSKGKQWCIDNIGITDAGVRYLAKKMQLKSLFKNNPVSNYKRGAHFRGKKRPQHSEYLKANHPLKGKHHSSQTKQKISSKIKLAIKSGTVKTNNFARKHHLESSKIKMRLKLVGYKHTKERTAKILNTKMKRYGKLGMFKSENNYSRCKRGYYDIGGKQFYFRSLWEANYALYLEFLLNKGLIKEWRFESETFWFEKIKRGVRSYLPDFKITNKDDSTEFHEVKGYMDSKSVTKIKRMKTYYPKVKLIIIDQACYKDIIKKAPIKFY